MGLFLAVALPPFQGQDEPYHFYRAYSISQGHLVEPIRNGRAGAQVETCVSAFVNYHFLQAEQPSRMHLREALTVPHPCTGQTSFVPFENTSNYSPVPYVPQVTALGLARALRLPIPYQFFAGRLATLLAFLAVVYLALRAAPRGQSVILVLGTLPMSLLLAATYSADAVTISMGLLLVAAVLRCLKDQRASWRWFALASGAALGVALAKPTYAILAPLLLLVPSRLFPSPRTSWAAKLGVLVVVAAAAGGWYLETRDVSLAGFLAPWMGRYDPQAQISFILHHPLGYAKEIGDLFFGMPRGDYAWSSFAAYLGYFRNLEAGSNFPPVYISVIAYVLLVQAYLWSAPRRFRWSGSIALKAALPPALVLLNVLGIVTVLFVEATGPGGVLTVQGRYFIPILAVPLASLAVTEATAPRARSVLPLVVWIVVMYVWLVLKVFAFFY